MVSLVSSRSWLQRGGRRRDCMLTTRWVFARSLSALGLQLADIWQLWILESPPGVFFNLTWAGQHLRQIMGGTHGRKVGGRPAPVWGGVTPFLQPPGLQSCVPVVGLVVLASRAILWKTNQPTLPVLRGCLLDPWGTFLCPRNGASCLHT